MLPGVLCSARHQQQAAVWQVEIEFEVFADFVAHLKATHGKRNAQSLSCEVEFCTGLC